MAYCITSQWVGNCPQLKLTVTSSETATSATLSYTLQYISEYPASSNPRSYKAILNGETVASGWFEIDGKTGTHTIATGTKTITKGTAKKNISFSCSMDFNLTWSGVYGGTKSASGSISIPAKTSYTITYNANNGTGAPSSQTKWHGTALTLATSKPTRTGYSFSGWATSSTGSVAYASGASYTANANVTLYAVWIANTYTIKYDANGGSGAPSNQTKTYGKTLTLSSTTPTRDRYMFKGWGSSASSTTVSYTAGSSYTTNASTTLYAIWELSYIKPRIDNYVIDRCNISGIIDDAGGYINIQFDYSCDENPVSYMVTAYNESGQSVWSTTQNISIASDHISYMCAISIANLDRDSSYTMLLTVTDSGGSSTAETFLGGTKYAWDCLPEGAGIAFGKPAELDDTADFLYKARFRKSVTLGDTIQDSFGPIVSYVTELSGDSDSEWRVRKWSDGFIEVWGQYHVHYDCNIALGSMYRTDAIQPVQYPATIYNPVEQVSYSTNGYGALVWITQGPTQDGSSEFYLIRPTSGTVNGTVNFYVTGTWK